jgi:slime mold repeat-containing protein
LRARVRSTVFSASLIGLVSLSAVTCTVDSSPPTGAVEQAAVSPPLPGNLNLILNAKTAVTIGAFTQVNGDVGSVGANGSVLFDVSSSQGFFSGFNVLANTVTVNTNASVGHIFGNDITVNGTASQQSLGLDPGTLPPVPAVTPATPGTTNVSTNPNQAKQLCPGQYGAISLGTNSTLNLNGGVYEVTRLSLADGARLEPSEPVVILVSGGVTTGIGSFIRPSAQALNPMTAASIRIEVGGAVTLGDSTQVRAHLLVTGKLTTGNRTSLTGAAWARTINIGPQSSVTGEGVFAAQAPSVPPPCNDNNACTADRCVSTGAAAFCQNTPTPSGSSCEDGNACDGAETCDGAGKCQPGTDLTAGTSCADGTVCNGDEACNGVGACVAGTPPEVTDRNPCTADACDPVTGVSHAPLPDGTACSGVGVCQGGVCSVQGTVFSDDFVQFQNAPAQCSHWNDFLINQLTSGAYGSVSMSGTFDLTGVMCSDPAAATRICGALHSGAFASVACNGHTWNVGSCGGTELNVDASICACSFNSHTVRPCTNENWGGINTSTCDGPSQNMTVVCQ